MNRIVSLTAITTCVWVMGSGIAGAAKSGPPDDTKISDAIEDEMVFDHAIDHNDVLVTTLDGVVTLTGEVPAILEKERAAKIAETVKGVRAVINRISVAPHWGRSSWQLERDVENAMLYDPAADSFEIDVDVEGHTAFLKGEVESWHERDLAERIAKGVKGVTRVDNRLTVDHAGERSDYEVETDIVSRLKWDVLVDHALIDVSVKDGEVTLSGIAGSAAEKRQARIDAWVHGVHSINDEGLRIAEWAADEHRRKSDFVVKGADEIEKAIETALSYDPRVWSFDVTPDVTGSVVTLRGTVDNLAAKEAAGQVARHTVGVSWVRNRLRVESQSALTATQIEESIEQAMLRDPVVESFEIQVSVTDHTARLSGMVDSYYEKARAQEIASKAAGVESVENHVTVEYEHRPYAYDPYLPGPYPYGVLWYDYQPHQTYRSDAAILSDIHGELIWSPFVDADQVDVTVDDGIATLEGTVDSWMEASAAVENAYEGGATWVRNKLSVN